MDTDEACLFAVNTLQNDESINYKIEQIIEITKCFDISLIKSKLSEHQNNVELAIGAVLTSDSPKQQRTDDVYSDEANFSSCSESSHKQSEAGSSKPSKKTEKKERQMERQRIKILEQREKEAQSKMVKDSSLFKSKNVKVIEASDLAERNQQQQRSEASEAPKIDLNIQTKSI